MERTVKISRLKESISKVFFHEGLCKFWTTDAILKMATHLYNLPCLSVIVGRQFFYQIDAPRRAPVFVTN